MVKKLKSESCGKRKIEGFITEREKKVIVDTLGIENPEKIESLKKSINAIGKDSQLNEP
ncbi:MAG: hypothetical protein Q8L29_01715 [archaeon]|nr:hypothetical protein [archaeon]